MANKRKIITVSVCVAFTLLCVLASPNTLHDPKGLCLLALVNFFLCRAFAVKRRSKHQTEKN